MTLAERGDRDAAADDGSGVSEHAARRRGLPRPLATIEWVLLAVFVTVTAIVMSFHAPFDAPFTDLFHEGEYISPRLFFDAGLHPLLIHGYIDYLPSEFAAAMCGANRVLACTRATNAGLVALAAIGFFGCAFALARSREAMLSIGLSVIALLLLINGRLVENAALQGGSPSVRDAPLLAALWCILAIPGRGRIASNMLAGIAGLIAGASVFWAYNRGLIGVAVIPLYSLSALLAGRGWKHAVAPLAGLGLGFAAAVLAEPDMWRQHITNIIYWSQHNDIWRYPFALDRLAVNSPVYLGFAVILLWTLWTALRLWRDVARRDEWPSLVVLFGITVLLIQQASNRDDPPHLALVLSWLLLLIFQLFNCAGWMPARDIGWRDLINRHSSIVVAVMAFLWVDYTSSNSIVRPLLVTTNHNLHLFARGMPDDIDLTPPETRRIVATLREADQRCTYVFNNGGGLYHLAGQRPCSTVMYPVYAAGVTERQIIADLTKARPTLVVGRSDDWFSSIDNKTLAMRTPRLATWLARNYPRSIRIGGTELRYLAQPRQSAAGSTLSEH